MSIITFVNNIKEDTGKSMSLVAIATYMGIEYNNKVLVVSTTDRQDKIKSCFFEDKQVKKIRFGIFGENKSTLDTESGIEGIAKIIRSNRLTPDMITNYTKVVFKDRLEILLGAEIKDKKNLIVVTTIEALIPNIKQGETKTLRCSATADLSNASNFEILEK